MQSEPLGASASDRISEIEVYRAFGESAAEKFDRLTRLVARILNVPCVIISLIEEDHQFWQSAVGLDHQDIERGVSFSATCTFSGTPLTVCDALNDARFSTNPLVTSSPHVRSYAGSPLATDKHIVIGALGVFDVKPRTFSAFELDTLNEFASLVVHELETQWIERNDTLVRRQLKENQNLASAAFHSAAIGMVRFGLDGTFLDVNRKACAILGRTREDLLSCRWQDITHLEDLDRNIRLRERHSLGENDEYSMEKRFLGRTGEEIWTKIHGRLVRGRSGAPKFYVTTIEDIREQRTAEIQRNLLIGELNHRVKNTLAVIKGVASQTVHNATSPEEFFASFEQRIDSLAKAHDLLTQGSWQNVPLQELLSSQLSGTGPASSSRITLEGPDVGIPSNVAVMLGLLFHELATNALKYGALKFPTGTVKMTWRSTKRDDVDWLEFDWIEDGCHDVVDSKKSGFGSQLLDRGVKFGLSGTSRRVFTPIGLNYFVCIPLHFN